MSEDKPIYQIRSPFRDPEGRNHEFAHKATLNGCASMCSCGWQCVGYFGSEEEAEEAWEREHVMRGAHVPYSPGPVLPNHVLLNLKKGDELPDGACHWNGIKECWERVYSYNKAKEGIAYSCPHFRLTPEQQRDIVKAQSYLTLEAAGVSKEHADRILGNGQPVPPSAARPLIDDLLDYCAKWQKRLRLMDWKVYVKIARMRDMDQPDRAAEIEMKRPQMIAYITFLDPQDYPNPTAYPVEPELNVIHELLHILTEPLDKVGSCEEEQAINRIAEALFNMEYETKPVCEEEYKEVRL